MCDQFMTVQEDKFILTTEIKTIGSTYIITHKVVNYSNKQIDDEAETYLFKGRLIKDPSDISSNHCYDSKSEAMNIRNELKRLADSQKQFILNSQCFD